MIREGLVLLAAGMGVVAVFLTLLVALMNCTGLFFRRFGARFVKPTPAETELGRMVADDTDAIAVVVAAVQAYRQATQVSAPKG